MEKKPPFAETLLAFIQAHPGLIATLTPEQLAEQTGYTLSEAKEYYKGVAQEKQRLVEVAADERFRQAKAEVITWISASQLIRVLYYPRLGVVRIKSSYQLEGLNPYIDHEDAARSSRWSRDDLLNTVLVQPQDGIDLGIYLSGLQPHIRETQARLATEPEPPEPEVPETFLPHLTPPDEVRLSAFARKHNTSATDALKMFNKHLITGTKKPLSHYSSTTSVDDVVIYAQGQHEAWQQLHILSHFQPCPQCPHTPEEDGEASELAAESGE
jgi:hypothetical protein